VNRRQTPPFKGTPAVLFAPILVVCLAFGTARAEITIDVTGSWTEFVDRSDLSRGPGSNLADTCTSPSNANLVSVSGSTGKNDAWEIYVKRIDTNWDRRLTMSARRTSSGKGPGSVSGGASYVLVGPSDTLFFTGKGTLRDIQVQLRLTGMSLSIPPGLRAATVQYTIIDVP
jgi:hypothetical protein